jgi:hypothetical protein
VATTWPGTDPAYQSVEGAIIGTGGLNAVGVAEAALRTRFEVKLRRGQGQTEERCVGVGKEEGKGDDGSGR